MAIELLQPNNEGIRIATPLSDDEILIILHKQDDIRESPAGMSDLDFLLQLRDIAPQEAIVLNTGQVAKVFTLRAQRENINRVYDANTVRTRKQGKNFSALTEQEQLANMHIVTKAVNFYFLQDVLVLPLGRYADTRERRARTLLKKLRQKELGKKRKRGRPTAQERQALNERVAEVIASGKTPTTGDELDQRIEALKMLIKGNQ